MENMNICNVLALLAVHYRIETLQRSEPSEEDQVLVEGLKGVIEEFNSGLCEIECTTTLVYGTYLAACSSHPELNEPASVQSTESSEPSSEGYKEEAHVQTDDVPPEYKKNAVGYWLSIGKKRRSIDNVKHHYSRVRSMSQLFRWKIQLKAGGNRSEKLLRIDKNVLEKFDYFAVEKKLNVHDVILRKWAILANREVGLNDFQASQTWCTNFKNRHGIVQRKNNKVVSRVTRKQTTEEFHNTVLDFVADAQEKISTIDLSCVFNTDQSGFNYELHSGRSLAYRGTKDMTRVVQSVNATTHSFTIQPLLSAAGEFVGPLYVVLQERSGELGDRVQEDLWNENGNLLISASTSGNVHKVNWKEWLADVYFPNVGPRSLLILDSYTTQAPCEQSLERIRPLRF